jgi:uncharacterized protein involved in response to NO
VVTPGVWRARNRLYRLLLPILAVLIAGNVVFHVGMLGDSVPLARLGNRLGLAGLILLFSLVGGLLTPIFTATAIGRPIPFRPWLEYAAVSALALMILAETIGLSGEIIAALALTSALFHALRMSPWHSLAIRGEPLLVAMHLGHAWLVVALLTKAAEAAGLGPAPSATAHAFTLGAMGLTMLSLMTRVALKHTGHPLRVVPMMIAGYGAMALAALARLVAELGPGGGEPLMASALLWLAAIILYLVHYGPMLIRPSRERSG